MFNGTVAALSIAAVFSLFSVAMKVVVVKLSAIVKRLVFKKAQFYDDYLVPEKDEYLRYKRNEKGKLVPKAKLKNKCWRLFSTMVIDVDGNVPACCFDKSGKYSFGNLKLSAVKDVWLGTKANKFRKAILNNRKGIDICNNCI